MLTRFSFSPQFFRVYTNSLFHIAKKRSSWEIPVLILDYAYFITKPMVLLFYLFERLKTFHPYRLKINFLGVKITLKITATDAFVGLHHYEDDIVIPGNVLLLWSMNSLNSTKSTSLFNKNNATVSC